MKKFREYYDSLLADINKIKNIPCFNKSIFFFERYNKDNCKFKHISFDDTEKIFDDLLENGCSWINITVQYIKNKTMFIEIDNSINFDNFFKGKTDVKISKLYIAGSNKFHWDLNIIDKIKYRKFLAILHRK